MGFLETLFSCHRCCAFWVFHSPFPDAWNTNLLSGPWRQWEKGQEHCRDLGPEIFELPNQWQKWLPSDSVSVREYANLTCPGTGLISDKKREGGDWHFWSWTHIWNDIISRAETGWCSIFKRVKVIFWKSWWVLEFGRISQSYSHHQIQ